MAIKLYKIIPFVVLLYSASGFAEEWQLQKNEDGIQVYTRSVDGYPYKAIRSVIHLENTRLSSVVSLIRNTKECPAWSTACKSATIIEWVELCSYRYQPPMASQRSRPDHSCNLESRS